MQIISEEEYLGKSKVNREDKNKYTRGNWILWTLHLKQTLVQQIWLKKIVKHANKQEKMDSKETKQESESNLGTHRYWNYQDLM